MPKQIVDPCHRLAAEREHDVAVAKAGGRGRAVRFHRDHENTGGDRELVCPRDGARDRDVLRRVGRRVGTVKADLAAMQQGLGTYQGLTNAEIAQQRDMLNQLYRVAARQEK